MIRSTTNVTERHKRSGERNILMRSEIAARVLILPVRVLGRMLRLCNQLEVVEFIVTPIGVLMMNVIAWWNWTVRCLPHISVQECPLPVCAGVVPAGFMGVLVTCEQDERKWFDCSHGVASTLKSLEDGLSAHAKSSTDLREAKSLLVKFVHSLCRLDVWFATHGNSVIERLASVNRYFRKS